MYLNVSAAIPAPQSIPAGFGGYFDWASVSDEVKAARGWPRYNPPPFDPLYQRVVFSFEEDENGVWTVSYAVEFVEDYEPVLEVLLARLAEKRWRVEEAGTSLPDGTVIPTDRTTQSKITAAYVKAKADPDYSIASWKFGAGQFGVLDAATIIAIGDAIEAHVQAAFSREAEITTLLSAKRATHTLMEAWETESDQGWPDAGT